MILLSPTAFIKQIRETGQAWNLSQMEGKLKIWKIISLDI
jgi:hypothetical protein